MKIKIRFCHLILGMAFILTAFNCNAQNQPDTLTYHIETSNGNTYIGNILSQDSEKLIFQSEKLGEITFLQTDIKEMHAINLQKMKGGKYWMDNPQATRYFYSPNGYGLKKGEGYYQNVWVLVNSFAVGITNNISIGGGLVPLFFFGGTPTPVWLTPKVSIPVKKENFNLGAGALVGTVVGGEDPGFGILYGITTFGSRDNNVSFGLGYGYAGGEWAKSPMININFMFRTGARGYIISENYYIQANGEPMVILSFGGRQIIKKAGLDYGLFIPFSSNLIALPWLGITIPFGNKKKDK
ncbi:MAG: hypothetical protein B6D64_12950 [Bacteroidetes bacterium 4484_276]|nr:MAG: hypothetical protein B6D64_12950 [Bacteroidetes bacterium 4484_276]OYT13318.1 MAG: hypothetical protein B6I19_05740 [Bacteroidetes bacterium 4572_114]